MAFGKGTRNLLKKKAGKTYFQPVKKVGNFEVGNVIEDVAGKAADQTMNGQVTDVGLGKHVNSAYKSLGNDASTAYQTSVVDPVNKGYESAKKLGEKLKKQLGDMQDSPAGGPLIPQVGTGLNTGGYPSAPVQIKAIAGGVGTTDPTGTSFRERQMTLAQQLAEQAAGGGPSLATEQLKQSQAANQAATFAQLASARGGANPGMARQAMQTSAQIQGQTARDAALARIQEQMGAREQLAGVSNQGRSGDIQVAGQGNELAVAQAQLAQQHAELQAKYTAMGLDAEKANQLAAIEMERMNRGIMSPLEQLLSTGTKTVTDIFT